MTPQKIIKALLKIVGNKGAIAGGAVRDIVLEQEPKDYDMFIYRIDDFIKIATKYSFTERINTTEPESVNQYGATNGDRSLIIGECEMFGKPIQMIYIAGVNHQTPYDVIIDFDFTINMMAYVDGEIYISDPAKLALSTREICLNENHKMACGSTNENAARFLMKRASYLSRKLEMFLPHSTIDAIYDKYQCEDPLSQRSF